MLEPSIIWLLRSEVAKAFSGEFHGNSVEAAFVFACDIAAIVADVLYEINAPAQIDLIVTSVNIKTLEIRYNGTTTSIPTKVFEQIVRIGDHEITVAGKQGAQKLLTAITDEIELVIEADRFGLSKYSNYATPFELDA